MAKHTRRRWRGSPAPPPAPPADPPREDASRDGGAFEPVGEFFGGGDTDDGPLVTGPVVTGPVEGEAFGGEPVPDEDWFGSDQPGEDSYAARMDVSLASMLMLGASPYQRIDGMGLARKALEEPPIGDPRRDISAEERSILANARAWCLLVHGDLGHLSRLDDPFVLADAERFVEVARSVSPGNPSIETTLALLRLRQGRTAEATQIIEGAMEGFGAVPEHERSGRTQGAAILAVVTQALVAASSGDTRRRGSSAAPPGPLWRRSTSTRPPSQPCWPRSKGRSPLAPDREAPRGSECSSQCYVDVASGSPVSPSLWDTAARLAEAVRRTEGSQRMWTQRETGRRWPFARMRDRANDARHRHRRAPRLRLADGVVHRPYPSGDAAQHRLGTPLHRLGAGRADPTEAPVGEPGVRSDEDPRLRRSGSRPPTWRILPGSGNAFRCASSPSAVASFALLIGGLAAGLTMATSANPPAHVHVADSPAADRLATRQAVLHLARATATPDPTPPQVAESAPTSAHEVFGYAPYWSLPEASQIPVDDFSTIAYFGVDVNPNGTIQTSGSGWNGYESQDFTDLVNAAHQAGDRVVLTATDFSNSSLDTLTHDPNAGVTLGLQLRDLVKDKNLDGVNLDFEGTGNGDQAGLDHLVSQVDFILHTTDPHYQLTMATYASSAGDPSGFYDIAGLSKWVNAFFVMAYDVNQGPSQGNGNAGGADASYISQYISAVGASKVILGLPLFGYDEPTSGPDLGDAATGPSQTVTYAQAMASGPTYWDAATQTAWTSYQSGGQWHQVFFDNVNTIAGKVQLAGDSGLLGVGAWALGMEGDDDSVLSTLHGGTTPLRTPPAGPATGSVSTQGPGFQESGQFGGPADVHHAVGAQAAGKWGQHHDDHDGRSERLDDDHRETDDHHDQRCAAVHDDVRRDGRNGNQQCQLHIDDRAAPLSSQCR